MFMRPSHLPSRRAIIDVLESRVHFDTTTPFTRVVIAASSTLANPPLEKTLMDVDGDGKKDAIVGFGNSGGIVWYQFPRNGNPASTWTRYTIAQTGGSNEDTIAYDVNADG